MVHASSRAVREVRGGEEDFLDGLEEDLLASRGNPSVEVAASAAQDASVPTHTWGIGATQAVGGQIQTISRWRVDAVVG